MPSSPKRTSKSEKVRKVATMRNPSPERPRGGRGGLGGRGGAVAGRGSRTLRFNTTRARQENYRRMMLNYNVRQAAAKRAKNKQHAKQITSVMKQKSNLPNNVADLIGMFSGSPKKKRSTRK